DALFRTFTGTTRRVVIVLAHDWYPIVSDPMAEIEARPPLRNFRFLGTDDAKWRKYSEAVPGEELRQQGLALLYLNLVPDYRHPGADIEGPFPFKDPDTFGYDHCVEGFEAICAAVATQYEIAGISSWGRHVWESLRRRLDQYASAPARAR